MENNTDQTGRELTGTEIAVIGAAGRFPGAGNIHEFWENLKNGVESVTFSTLPAPGLEENGSEEAEQPGFVKVIGGMLAGKEYFDASFFNFSPHDAEIMDPQMRQFFEVAWEVLESAGYDPYSYPGLIGLYAGAASSFNWKAMVTISGQAGQQGHFAASLLTGENYLPTRIAYSLNLKGPAVLVQTACSTSLVAIHMACQVILDGEADMALAGGVTLTIGEQNGYFYQQGGILSSDGHCRSFDALANGTINGEGIGVVALKNLEDALADGDNIMALVIGSAVNNDGNRKMGYTAPSVTGQAQVIRIAHQVANVEPGSITYVETHGSGTTLGDPIEIEALTQAFDSDDTDDTGAKQFCGIGSVKTNVGHLDAAAGAAGFIKTLLALKHKIIPPSLHYNTPNPGIDFENSPFYVNTTPREWRPGDSGIPLRAGVSSFGIGGTNAHIVLEEWPATEPAATAQPPARPYHLLLLSAKTQTALDQMTQNLAAHFRANPLVSLADAAYTLQVGRKQFQYRRKMVCTDISSAIDGLTSGDPRKIQTYHSPHEQETNHIVFMFPGLGAQYVNMGLGLYRSEPLFRDTMDRCFGILNRLLDYNIKEIVFREDPAGEPSSLPSVHRTDIAQLIIFIFGYSLASLLMEWGLGPRSMIGYSFGEYLAACVSGVFSLEDALKLIVMRGKLLEEIPAGMMLSVPLPAQEVEPHTGEQLSLAIDNGPTCVVSGTVDAVRDFEKEMREKRVMCLAIDARHAIHSPMMDPLLDRFQTQVSQLTLNPPQIPYISTVTGEWVRPDDAVSPAYWAKQLRHAVQFEKGMQLLTQQEESVMLEIGPGRDISTMVKRETGHKKVVPLVEIRSAAAKTEGDPLTPDDHRYLLDRIGLLWLYGVCIDWTRYYGEEKRQRVALPSYPFEKRKFWKLGEDYKSGKLAQFGKRLDSITAPPKSTDPAHWFYLPTWKIQPLLSNHSPRSDSNSPTWLVFTDDSGVAAGLIERLKLKEAPPHDLAVVTVETGDRFENPDTHRYRIRPGEFDDYEMLMKELNEKDSVPDHIIHCWGVSSGGDGTGTEPGALESRQVLGFYSLSCLARALGSHRDNDSTTRIHVVTSNMHDISGTEELQPAKSTVLGPCRVIPHEYPGILCKSIDLQIPGPGYDPMIRGLYEEVMGPWHGAETMVAYRGRRRWLRDVEPIRLEASREPRLLREQGIYIITGGLGKTGFTLALYLARQVRARLVLAGPSQSRNREDFNKKIQQLKEAGAAVLVCPVDVSGHSPVEEAVITAQQRFGPIHGVIHTGGIVEEGVLSPIETITGPSHSPQFLAGLYELTVLAREFEDKPLDFCMLISSLSTITGGPGLLVHAATGRFMDAFAMQMNRRGQGGPESTPWIAVNWDVNGEDPDSEYIPQALDRIFSTRNIEQVLFSTGGDLKGRIARSVPSQDAPGEEDKSPDDSASLYSRPQLSTPYLSPRNETERQLANIWQRFFRVREAGIHDDFFQLGGDSLKAINLISIIHKELNISIPIKEFFDSSTIAGVARHISGARVRQFRPLEPVEEKEYYPLSSAQRRVYIIQQMDRQSVFYNIPEVLILEGNVDMEKLSHCLGQLGRRHQSLRTSFFIKDNQPMQRIHPPDGFEIDAVTPLDSQNTDQGKDQAKETVEELAAAFIRPFDLARPSLFRSKIMPFPGSNNGNNTKYIWMIDTHHIISDGTSIGVLVREFMAFYQGRELPPLPLQYKDYSQWENREHQVIRQQEEYWLREFGTQAEIPVLELPLDYTRPRVRGFEGKSVTFLLDPRDTQALKRLALEKKTTLYTLLLTLYNIFLARLSNQETIVVGTPIAGRRHADLENIIGMFVDTLVMKNDPAGEKAFGQFFGEVSINTLNAFANQDYRYEDLVEKVVVNRDPGRNPLFDAMLVLQNVDVDEIESPDLKISPYTYDHAIAKFDLTLLCTEQDDRLWCSLEYSTALFMQETIQRFVNYLKNIISSVLRDTRQQVSQIEMLAEEEKKQLILEFNDTGEDYPTEKNKTIYQLFEQMVAKYPEHSALVFMDRIVTFRHFDDRANRLAHYLMAEQGLQPGGKVAVLMDRSIELIIVLMAIMKARGAYVPMDASLPSERIRVVFNDASIGTAISQQNYFAKLSDLQPQCPSLQPVLYIEDLQETMDDLSTAKPDTGLIASPDTGLIASPGSGLIASPGSGPAYIMYTSGSSGVPKGVLVEHRTIINTIIWRRDKYEYAPGYVSLQVPPHYFDSSVTDIFCPLLG
ncbi:MAG: acyltransferase domain-containing protein, partial [bacterium]|nr:acyltransferase domain-containing protein [bacterium]